MTKDELNFYLQLMRTVSRLGRVVEHTIDALPENQQAPLKVLMNEFVDEGIKTLEFMDAAWVTVVERKNDE
tara:strand:- start:431615 stop:431827 length:213 start_codon:yes stop_codon:yes gene_type:complete